MVSQQLRLAEILAPLNQRQREAVESEARQRLVLAGPGSGKTRCLVMAVGYDVVQGRVKADQVCAITFTNKAARDMKERLATILTEEELGAIQASTFHSLGVKILRQHPQLAGRKPGFTIYDDDDQMGLLKRIFGGEEQKRISAGMIKHFVGQVKNGMADLNDSSFEPGLIAAYRRYERALREANAVDFDDLIKLPVEIFQQHPQVLEQYQDKFRMLYIDEYQDTNGAQYLFTKLLSQKYQHLFVVGDDDQSIYGFRGADFRNLMSFEQDFPKCEVFILDQNYRSNQGLVDIAQGIIRHNVFRKEKHLWAGEEEFVPANFIVGRTDREEASKIVDEILRLQQEGFKYQDCAILYRTNNQSRAMEMELNRRHIPYLLVGGVAFYSRKEIKDVVAYLKLLVNPNDRMAFQRAINTPTRGLGTKAVDDILKRASESKKDLLEATRLVVEEGGLGGKGEAGAREFLDLMEDLKQDLKGETLHTVTETLLTRSGYWNYLNELPLEEQAMRRDNIDELLGYMDEERRVGERVLGEFLELAALMTDQDKTPESKDRVTLITMHRSKGLEYPVVFCSGIEERILPHFRAQGDDEIEEERRLLYVALTRAMKRVYVTRSQRRQYFGRIQDSSPSPFWFELPKDKFVPFKEQAREFNSF